MAYGEKTTSVDDCEGISSMVRSRKLSLLDRGSITHFRFDQLSMSWHRLLKAFLLVDLSCRVFPIRQRRYPSSMNRFQRMIHGRYLLMRIVSSGKPKNNVAYAHANDVPIAVPAICNQ